MANSRSARKRIRASERKRVRNRIVRSAVRTRIGRVRRSLVSGQVGEIEEELRAAVKALDKAAEKGILHPNNAARRKSRIMAMASRLTRAGESEEQMAATRAAATGGAKGRTTRQAAASGRTPAASAVKPTTAKSAAAKPAAKPAARAATPAKPGTAPKPARATRKAKTDS